MTIVEQLHFESLFNGLETIQIRLDNISSMGSSLRTWLIHGEGRSMTVDIIAIRISPTATPASNIACPRIRMWIDGQERSTQTDIPVVTGAISDSYKFPAEDGGSLYQLSTDKQAIGSIQGSLTLNFRAIDLEEANLLGKVVFKVTLIDG